MQQFVFTPVETSCGRLCISVWYCSSISDISSEPSTPLSPQFIPDYVGNPMAEPLKQFPSGSVPQSLYPLERCHSWSYDLYRASPPPSPTYSESQASINQTRATCLPPPTSRPQVHTKNTSFDEYWPSPTISTSPSLSPSPTYAPTGVSGIGKALLRFGSAPVRIPDSRLLGVPFRFYNQLLAPSPPLKGVRPTSAKTDKSSSLAAKSFSPAKDDGDKLCVVKVTQTNISPQNRSSSRLSYQDEYKDSEFSGPFVVDDDDGFMTDHDNRICSLEQTREPHEPGGGSACVVARKPPQASVGTLISMLKKAPPLRQDSSSSSSVTINPTTPTTCNVASPANIITSKTTTDALEELRVYREMKDLLLKQGRKSQMS